METDDAQDEAPRFPKTLAIAVDLFRLLDLVVLLYGVNVVGLSAFKSVERRMAPLSHNLAGIVLPYDHFDNDVDSSGKTIDRKMEEKNFQKTAEVLSNVWVSVNCRTVPVGSLYKPTTLDPVWVAKHCQQFLYYLQIVKYILLLFI